MVHTLKLMLVFFLFFLFLPILLFIKKKIQDVPDTHVISPLK